MADRGDEARRGEAAFARAGAAAMARNGQEDAKAVSDRLISSFPFAPPPPPDDNQAPRSPSFLTPRRSPSPRAVLRKKGRQPSAQAQLRKHPRGGRKSNRNSGPRVTFEGDAGPNAVPPMRDLPGDRPPPPAPAADATSSSTHWRSRQPRLSTGSRIALSSGAGPVRNQMRARTSSRGRGGRGSTGSGRPLARSSSGGGDDDYGFPQDEEDKDDHELDFPDEMGDLAEKRLSTVLRYDGAVEDAISDSGRGGLPSIKTMSRDDARNAGWEMSESVLRRESPIMDTREMEDLWRTHSGQVMIKTMLKHAYSLGKQEGRTGRRTLDAADDYGLARAARPKTPTFGRKKMHPKGAKGVRRGSQIAAPSSSPVPDGEEAKSQRKEDSVVPQWLTKITRAVSRTGYSRVIKADEDIPGMQPHSRTSQSSEDTADTRLSDSQDPSGEFRRNLKVILQAHDAEGEEMGEDAVLQYAFGIVRSTSRDMRLSTIVPQQRRQRMSIRANPHVGKSMKPLKTPVKKVHRAMSTLSTPQIERELSALQREGTAVPREVREFLAPANRRPFGAGASAPSAFSTLERKFRDILASLRQTAEDEADFVETLRKLNLFWCDLEYDNSSEMINFMHRHPSLLAIATAGRALLPLNSNLHRSLLEVANEYALAIEPKLDAMMQQSSAKHLIECVNLTAHSLEDLNRVLTEYSNLMPQFGSFASHQDQVEGILEAAPKVVQETIEDVTSQLCDEGETIQALLEQPVKRVPRYVICQHQMKYKLGDLKDMLEMETEIGVPHTVPESLADSLRVLHRGFQQLQVAADAVTEAVRESHDRRLLHRLWKLLVAPQTTFAMRRESPLPKSFVRQGRRFLHEGPLWMDDEKVSSPGAPGVRRGYWCWLFSNMLLVTESTQGAHRPRALEDLEEQELGGNPAPLRDNSVTLRLMLRFATTASTIHKLPPTDDLDCAFLLATEDGVHTFYASGRENRDAWVNEFQQSMQRADKQRAQLMRVRRVSTQYSTSGSSGTEERLSDEDMAPEETLNGMQPREVDWFRRGATQDSASDNKPLLKNILRGFDHDNLITFLSAPTEANAPLTEMPSSGEDLGRSSSKSSEVLRRNSSLEGEEIRAVPLPLAQIARVTITGTEIKDCERYRFWFLKQCWCFQLRDTAQLVKLTLLSGAVLFGEVKSTGRKSCSLLAAAPLEELTAASIEDDSNSHVNAVQFQVSAGRSRAATTASAGSFDWGASADDEFSVYAKGWNSGFNLTLCFETRKEKDDLLALFWDVKNRWADSKGAAAKAVDPLSSTAKHAAWPPPPPASAPPPPPLEQHATRAAPFGEPGLRGLHPVEETKEEPSFEDDGDPHADEHRDTLSPLPSAGARKVFLDEPTTPKAAPLPSPASVAAPQRAVSFDDAAPAAAGGGEEDRMVRAASDGALAVSLSKKELPPTPNSRWEMARWRERRAQSMRDMVLYPQQGGQPRRSAAYRLFNNPVPGSRRASTEEMPSKTGWLYKRGTTSSRFFSTRGERRRFFVLQWGTLAYYKSESEFQRDATAQRDCLFNIDECVVDLVEHESGAVFAIIPVTQHGGHKPLELRASSPERMREWVDAIKESGARPVLGPLPALEPPETVAL